MLPIFHKYDSYKKFHWVIVVLRRIINILNQIHLMPQNSIQICQIYVSEILLYIVPKQ